MSSYVDNLKINNLYYRNTDTKCRRVTSTEQFINNPILNINQSNYNTGYYNIKKYSFNEKPKTLTDKIQFIYEPERTLRPLDSQNNPYSYDDSNFWNKNIDYNNLVDDTGNKVYLTGVCNPLLLDSCENINEKDNVPMNGICTTSNINKNTFHFSVDTDMSLSQNYKINTENTFNMNNSFKLESGTLIVDSINNKEDFAKKYCRTGQFEVRDDKHYCL